MKVVELWDDPSESTLYWKATIQWTKPRTWWPGENFRVADNISGCPGLYRFTQHHGKLPKPRTVYIGATEAMAQRLTKNHHKKPRYGTAKVSCGVVDFNGRHFKRHHLLQIEDILKFYVWDIVRNERGFDSLPGFRANQKFVHRGWHISNRGFRGELPAELCYPTFARS